MEPGDIVDGGRAQPYGLWLTMLVLQALHLHNSDPFSRHFPQDGDELGFHLVQVGVQGIGFAQLLDILDCLDVLI